MVRELRDKGVGCGYQNVRWLPAFQRHGRLSDTYLQKAFDGATLETVTSNFGMDEWIYELKALIAEIEAEK